MLCNYKIIGTTTNQESDYVITDLIVTKIQVGKIELNPMTGFCG